MLLAFDDDGPGPVVVLLHGFPLDRSIWAPQQAEVGAVYRVIAMDLRGHGQTAAPGGPYAIDDMADDVLETLDALQLTAPVVIGGLSMGGYVALSAVARHPERFRALILADTKATADTPEAAKARHELAAKVEASGATTAVVDGMLPRFFGKTTRRDRPEVVASVHDMMARTSPRAVVGALRGMAARPDRTADLARITIPTLVLVGEDDVISTPAEARAMAEALPKGRLVVIPDAGHLAPLENPKAGNAAILDFLNGLN